MKENKAKILQNPLKLPSFDKAGRMKTGSSGKKSFEPGAALIYITAFLLPVAAMLMIFAGKGIYPFGDRSFLRTDLYHQYAPFFQEFKDKLSSGESLTYTWDIGLGTNFLALYGYYLASPINWLILLCPRANVIEFITYGVVLRAALASLTMTYYLNQKSGKLSFGSVFFGTFYSMSGYMAAYSWNIMWLDCIFLFPLIMLGLERLITENRCILYCVSLALCIISNYYISIMVCIGVVFCFAVFLISYDGEDDHYLKKVLNFFLYSLLAGGMAAVVLIPEMKALSTTASGNVSFPTTFKSYFTMFDMLSRHLFLTNIEIGLGHWPNIYCGVAILFFIPLYYFTKKISFREKIAYTLLLIFFLLSFSLDVLNFIWHGFHYPNSLPCRQSFIYIFLLLSMGFQAYRDIKSRKDTEILGALGIALIFVVLAEKLESEYTGKNLDVDDMYYAWYSFYASIGFLLFYGCMSFLHARSRRKLTPILAAAVIAAVLVESTVNMSVTSITTVSRSSYVKDDLTVRAAVSELEEEADGDFFRVEKLSNRSKNDGAWLDYRSASIFSSTAYSDLTAFYKKLGMESSTNAYGSQGQSFPAYMLLNIQYSLSSSALTESDLRSLKLDRSEDGLYFYENTYVLPAAFLVDNELSADWNTSDVNPAENWNSLGYAAGLTTDLFVLQENVINNDTTVVSAALSDSGYCYIYINKSGPAKAKVVYDGFSKEYSNLTRGYFISLETLKADTAITITNTDSSKSDRGMNVSVYVLNEDALADLYEILNVNPLTDISYTSDSMSGSITCTEEKTMFTSIPYDKGWTVTIDGQKVETSAFEDTFLSFKVPAGSHTIKMHYTADGLLPGFLISLVSLLLFILIGIFTSALRKKRSSDLLAKDSAASDDPEADPEDYHEDFDENFDENFDEDPDEADDLDNPDEDAEVEGPKEIISGKETANKTDSEKNTSPANQDSSVSGKKLHKRISELNEIKLEDPDPAKKKRPDSSVLRSGQKQNRRKPSSGKKAGKAKTPVIPVLLNDREDEDAANILKEEKEVLRKTSLSDSDLPAPDKKDKE